MIKVSDLDSHCNIIAEYYLNLTFLFSESSYIFSVRRGMIPSAF